MVIFSWFFEQKKVCSFSLLTLNLPFLTSYLTITRYTYRNKVRTKQYEMYVMDTHIHIIKYLPRTSRYLSAGYDIYLHNPSIKA